MHVVYYISILTLMFYDSAWEVVQVHIQTFLCNCDLISVFFFWYASIEITLAYLGIYNQPINCLISLNLVSRDLCRV